MNQERLLQVLIAPHLSEKSTLAADGAGMVIPFQTVATPPWDATHARARYSNQLVGRAAKGPSAVLRA